MIDRKHRKLKRHPLVRFIRGVVRLFKVVFKAKKNRPTYTIEHHDLAIEHPDLAIEPEPIVATISQSDRRNRDKLITVGELFDRVNWQIPTETIQENIPESFQSDRAYDVSRN